jgi:hypothetical protein
MVVLQQMATWEPVADFKERYLAFQLVELFVGEEGNVVDSFLGPHYRCQTRRPPASG